ncbi:rod shape-determining protein [Actinomadura macrotermitis]|uniref:Cell shape-determining protein MreB n=1 Tax=Actinomadura macrotermitis TaxID=2585200 RepID=A0A7K0BU26_9ACTN|nr:MreB-like protein [Actinomadura macrotermitis]
MFLRGFPGRPTALDLGSTLVRMHIAGRGLIAAEPCALARCRQTGRVLAVGRAALELAAKRPDVKLIRPVRLGVPAEQEDTEAILRRLLRRSHGSRYFARPRMVVAAPSSITPVQHGAVCEAAYRAGARRLTVVPRPLAAAVGAGLLGPGREIAVVADIGAHVTDIGLVSFGGLAGSATLPIGGATLDEAIVDLVRTTHELIISAETAEAAKIAIGTAAANRVRHERRCQVYGRDVHSGLPRTVMLSCAEVHEVIMPPITSIVAAIADQLAASPPDIAAELVSAGITLTGGSAAIEGLDRLVHKATGLPVRVADDPANAAVTGAAALLVQHRKNTVGDRAGDYGLLSLPKQRWPSRGR